MTLSSYKLMATSSLVALSVALPSAATEQRPEMDASDIEIISVTGDRVDRKKITGSATSIKSEQLEKFKYEDVNRILRFVPGVTLQEEDGFGLRPNIGLRGSGAERSSKITLMEDGVLIAPAAYAAPSAYYFPVTARMTGVEVRKGSAAIAYGPRTVGGAVNLLSRPIPEEMGGFVDLRYGRFNQRTMHASVGGTFDKFGANLEYYGSRNDGFKKLASGANTGFDVDDFTFKGEYRLIEGEAVDHTLSVKLGRTRQDSDETYLGLTENDFNSRPNYRYTASELDHMDSNHEQYQLSYKVKGDTFNVVTTAYRNDFARDWFKFDGLYLDGSKQNTNSILGNPADNKLAYLILSGRRDSDDGAVAIKHNARDYVSQGVQSVVNFSFDSAGMSHDLQLSARYHEDSEDRLQYSEYYTMMNGSLHYDSEGVLGSGGNRLSSAKAVALYAQDTIQWGKWTFVPGIRFETIDMMREDWASTDSARAGGVTGMKKHSVDSVTPGLGFSYSVSDQWVLTGGIFEGFNPPGVGDTNAKVESSTSVEFGFSYTQERTFIEAMSFYSDYSNILGSCTASVGCAGEIGDQYNGGAAEIYGLELTAQTGFDLSDGWAVTVGGVYTYTKATFQTNFEDSFWGDVSIGDQLPYMPEHQISLQASIAKQGFSYSVTMNHVSESRAVAGQGTIDAGDGIDARTLVDVALTYTVMDGVDVFFSADNVFNTTYIAARRPMGLRPGKPRSWQFGVKYSF